MKSFTGQNVYDVLVSIRIINYWLNNTWFSFTFNLRTLFFSSRDQVYGQYPIVIFLPFFLKSGRYCARPISESHWSASVSSPLLPVPAASISSFPRERTMERAKNTPDSTVDHRAIARGVHLQRRRGTSSTGDRSRLAESRLLGGRSRRSRRIFRAILSPTPDRRARDRVLTSKLTGYAAGLEVRRAAMFVNKHRRRPISWSLPIGPVPAANRLTTFSQGAVLVPHAASNTRRDTRAQLYAGITRMQRYAVRGNCRWSDKWRGANREFLRNSRSARDKGIERIVPQSRFSIVSSPSPPFLSLLPHNLTLTYVFTW